MVKALGHGLYWNMSSWGAGGGPYSDKVPPRNSSFTYHTTTCKAHWLDLQGRTWLLPRTIPLPLFSKDPPPPPLWDLVLDPFFAECPLPWGVLYIHYYTSRSGGNRLCHLLDNIIQCNLLMMIKQM